MHYALYKVLFSQFLHHLKHCFEVEWLSSNQAESLHSDWCCKTVRSGGSPIDGICNKVICPDLVPLVTCYFLSYADPFQVTGLTVFILCRNV